MVIYQLTLALRLSTVRLFKPVNFVSISVQTITRLQMSIKKPKVVFVLGAPGSGKGTVCSKLVEHYNFVHLSAGDLLRAERNTPGSPYGALIEKHIVNGTIVPVAITCNLIERAMNTHEKNMFLIDGFPRNYDNLQGWQQEMSEKTEVLGVLFIECPEDECTTRCLKRGAAGSGRSDDNRESLCKRFDTYQNATMPIIKHYDQHQLVFTVNGNQNEAAVFENVRQVMTKVLPSQEA